MSRLERLVERWPMALIWAGLLLFWLACVYSEHLPEEALFVGPAMAIAGVVMREYNRRQA